MSTGQRRSAPESISPARQHLLDTTVAIIQSDGLEAATSRAISTKAGENLGSITYYFGSKGALIDEAMVMVANKLIEPVLVVMDDAETEPTQALFQGIQILHQTLNDNRSQVPAYLQCLASAAIDSTSVRPHVQQLHRSLRQAVTTAIERYQQSGAVADWIDPSAMATLIVAVSHGVAIADAIDPDTIDTAKVASQFGGLILSTQNQPPSGS